MSAVASQQPTTGEPSRNELPRDPVRPSGHRYIREFDGLRGLSILFVIAYHCWGYGGSGIIGNLINRVTGIGWSGVDIFFVLSGFLITGILLDTRDSPHYWRSFLVRRGLRIFPLYYAVLLLILIDAWSLHTWGIGVHDAALANIDRIWMNFLYVSNFSMAVQGSNHVPMNIAWSLAIEEQFYLLYPAVVLWCAPNQLKRILIGAVLLAPILRGVVWLYGPQPTEGPYALPFCRMDALAIGALAQIAVRNPTSYWMRFVARYSTLMCLCAIFGMLVWTRDQVLFVVLGYSFNVLAAAALLSRALTADANSRLRTILVNPALVYVGKLAYGLYLLHLMGRSIFDALVIRGSASRLLSNGAISGFRLVAITAIALAMASLSYYFFEMPILRLKDRWAPSKQRYEEPIAAGGI